MARVQRPVRREQGLWSGKMEMNERRKKRRKGRENRRKGAAEALVGLLLKNFYI